MSGGTFDERDPCAERGSFHLDGGKPPEGTAPDGDDRDGKVVKPKGCGVQVSPGWWPDRFRSFLCSSSSYIVDRLGERNVRAVVLAGSFALDEGSVVFTSSGPVFLSDVDLVLILSSREAHAAAYRLRGELGKCCEELFPEAVFSGRIEIGTFLPDELKRLPARPGVFDLRSHGAVLWGDGDVLAHIPAFREEDIDGDEALVLVENRMMSLLDTYPEEGKSVRDLPYSFWYEIARVHTDIGTAALCIDRSYVSGYGRRARRLAERVDDGSIASLISRAALADVSRWTRFKLDPSSGLEEARRAGRSARGNWGETARIILDFWKRGAVHVLDSPGDPDRPPSVPSLLRRRRRRGGGLYNLRFWKGWLSRLPVSERIRVAALLRATLLRMSPLDAVREDGIRLIDHWMRSGESAPLPGLAVAGAGTGGGWRAAAADAHGIWAGMVFGREES